MFIYVYLISLYTYAVYIWNVTERCSGRAFSCVMLSGRCVSGFQWDRSAPCSEHVALFPRRCMIGSAWWAPNRIESSSNYTLKSVKVSTACRLKKSAGASRTDGGEHNIESIFDVDCPPLFIVPLRLWSLTICHFNNYFNLLNSIWRSSAEFHCDLSCCCIKCCKQTKHNPNLLTWHLQEFLMLSSGR